MLENSSSWKIKLPRISPKKSPEKAFRLSFLTALLHVFLQQMHTRKMYLWKQKRFEHFGSDLKRTIMNLFVSRTCWTYLEFCIINQGLNILRYLIAPLPESVCFVKTIIVNSIAVRILFFVDGIIVARYLFVLVLKNPFAFQDDFW